MAVANNKLSWFKLKCPYPKDTTEYRNALSRLGNASLADMNKLDAEFNLYRETNHTVVSHHFIDGEWLAIIGTQSKPIPAQNMKAIQRHGHKYRVQQRKRGQLRRWTFNTLTEAVAKRDAIFA